MSVLIPQGKYVDDLLEKFGKELSEQPRLYAEYKRGVEKRIDSILEQAGVLAEVAELRASLEAKLKSIQSRADRLNGQRDVLRDIHEKYLLAPIPEGVTHMYGIELGPLDPQTRLRVMSGQDGPGWHETVTTLGGDPEFRDWDGTWEDEGLEGDEEVHKDQQETPDGHESPTGPKPSPTPARAPKKRGKANPTTKAKTAKGKTK